MNPIEVRMSSSWKHRLKSEFEKDYFHQLVYYVKTEYKTHKIYPPAKEIFSSFDNCDFHQTKVVIIGQDPYHREGQANGLCFSVRKHLPVPPSLRNIFRELDSDLGIPTSPSGDLARWAKQGVLLLNSVLTVKEATPQSHSNKGWEIFTDAVIRSIVQEKENVVFLLWGSYAQRKGGMIDRKKHCVLTAAHPSPFSVNQGFFGCKHFSKTNTYLAYHHKPPIVW